MQLSKFCRQPSVSLLSLILAFSSKAEFFFKNINFLSWLVFVALSFFLNRKATVVSQENDKLKKSKSQSKSALLIAIT